MKYSDIKPHIIFFILSFTFNGFASGQFLDDFNDNSITLDPDAKNGWAFFTGDGEATMEFRQGDGFASILVDATDDKRNIWWALIKRQVSAELDLNLLKKSGYELRIEACIRVSDAPRRVNLHLNTQRTIDFHTHLMEFDIPDTTNWHTISMTTQNFEVEPTDYVFGQLALMDWGLGKYRVDVDYFRVDIVNTATVEPDKGAQVRYHPPVPDPSTFAHEVNVAQDSIIDAQYPDMNFNLWSAQDNVGKPTLLTVSGAQFVIMRWDLSYFAGKQITGYGLLELTIHSVQRSSDKIKDFGMIRVVEISGGDPNWNQETVTYSNFCRKQSIEDVLNPQMIIDIDVTAECYGKTFATISKPVLQRMLDGKTLGLAIRPLGAINASFYSMENQQERLSPRLCFNVQNF
jgi:hypothetical protein